jgi:uncharacterized protein YbjT (DUF2867 family)
MNQSTGFLRMLSMTAALGLASALLAGPAVAADAAAAVKSGTGPAAVVLVAGATGGTGREVVRQALASGYRVRVLVRDEARARPVLGDDIEYAVGNVLEPATLGRALQGVDYVVSALGSNSQKEPENRPERVDYGGVKSLAEAASRAGVKHFVLVSSMGVTQPDHYLNKAFDNILTWKLKGEDALRASGLRYTIVRPGGLRDEPGGKAGISAMQGDPKGIRAGIPRADVAAVCVNALGRADADRKTFEIVSGVEGERVDWASFFAGFAADGR